MRKTVRSLRLLIGLSIRVSPASALGCLAETLGVAVRLSEAWMLALLVAAAGAGDIRRMAIIAAVVVGQVGVSRLLITIGMTARINQLERVGQEVSGRIALLTAGIPTLETLDDPRYLDQLHILREQQGALGGALNTLLNQLNSIVNVVGVLTLAVAADPRMLIVAVASLPTVAAGPLIARWQQACEDVSAEPGRLAHALLGIGIDARHAAELRVFGLGGPLRTRQLDASKAWRAPMLRLAVKESTLTALTQVVFFGTAAGVLGWLVHDAVQHDVSVAAVTLAILLVTRLQSVSSTLRSVISETAGMSRTAGRFLWLEDLAGLTAAESGGQPSPPGPVTMRCSAVDYRHPGSQRDALTDISLTVEPGTVLAVVGENGAGKSTFAELIAGLRRPSSGEIRCAGQSLAELDPIGWRARVAGAFQDHVRFELIMAEAVGIGDLPRLDDEDQLRAAIAAGAADAVLDTLPNGLQTQLGGGWPGGVELSGGQWQRVAIARGLMRQTPAVRILDEPTAALDALTESELFGRYARIARSGRRAGTITILITHRFSTVAAADRIIVLDAGRIVEDGTHDELLATGGHYAELYNLQASGYRD